GLPQQGRRHAVGPDRGGAAVLDVLMIAPQGSAAVAWLDAAREILDRIADTQAHPIDAPSQWCSDAIAADGLAHLFGTGHSRIPVEEMFPRYGSYPGFNPIVELS